MGREMGEKMGEMKESAIASLMVPSWYRAAFRQGASIEARRAMVQEACLAERRALAAERGEPVPDSVADEVVALTCAMYELALGCGHEHG